MSYNPLDIQLKKGDVIDVTLIMYDDGLRTPRNRNRIVWQGQYKSCEFEIQVPKEYDGNSIAGETEITINNIQVGRLTFHSKIVSNEPNYSYAEVMTYHYGKIFISYAHQDKRTADIIAKTCKAQKIDYFFDRHNLNIGDIYPEEIYNYINSADLFILCWSENAAKSSYVKKEYTQALSLAYPQRKREEATLKICPFSITPHADPPLEMREVYNFEKL